MSEETTPLTSNLQYGPTYVFPGGVSPHSRRRKMARLQCCMAISFVIILIAALFTALAVYDYDATRKPLFFHVLNATTNETTSDEVRHALESTTSPLVDEPAAEWALQHINSSESEQAVSAGIKALGDRELLEEGLQSMPVDTPAFRHYRSLSTNAEARKLARRGYVENHATMRIAQVHNYTKQPGRSNIGMGPRIVLPDPSMNFSCDFNAPYRRANGVCNNKVHTRLYGAAMVPYRRMVAPDYADGISTPRASHNSTLVNGTQDSQPLPSARTVSLKIHRASYETDSNFTVMLAVFGQFLDHDITATSLTSSQEGESINCCTVPLSQHPECFPVPIADDDPYYKQYNVTCLNFVRSAPAPTGHFGPRQQLNQATAFIDGSVIYGNTEPRQRHLRSLSNGTLRMFMTTDERELLPLSTGFEDGCNRLRMALDGKYCFESGDDRANENLLLTSMHLLWARQHNYLARGLQEVNPKWDDERIYQETRKIVGAQLAHITYNEFIPVLLGRELAGRKGLLPAADDLNAPDTYNTHTDPNIANEFAAAAFRFAHTLLPGLFNITRNNSTPEAVELHKMLFNPFSLWAENGIDNALLTACNTPVARVDRFFSLEVTQKMFEGTAEDKLPVCGLDLVSLNIQRGRDHGLPAYPVFRRHCKLPPTDTWEQMSYAVDNSSLDSIKQIYSSPLDVDVYTGALSERPLDGAIFGPLLTCLVSDQFLRLKQGDSFWYERKFGPQRFTKDQLREIYKTTLSRIICRNSDSIQRVRMYVMERRQESPNVYADCADIDTFNFMAWSEAAHQPSRLHSVRVNQAAMLIRIIDNVTTPMTSTTPIANLTTVDG